MNCSTDSISVIIPTKDRLDDIQRCIASTRRQKRLPDEVIVIDQSKEPYQLESFPQLRHVYAPFIKGAASARNVGATLAKSDILLFVDDDVELLPNTVGILMEQFAAAPDVIGMQCPDVMPHVRAGRLSQLLEDLFDRGPFSRQPYWRKGVEYRTWLSGYAMAFRAGLFKKEVLDDALLGYSYGEDWEFSQRARRHGTLRVALGAGVLHHQSPTNREQHETFVLHRWVNFHYFFQKMGAQRNIGDRMWLKWWELGECYRWLRAGMGFPSWSRCDAVKEKFLATSDNGAKGLPAFEVIEDSPTVVMAEKDLQAR